MGGGACASQSGRRVLWQPGGTAGGHPMTSEWGQPFWAVWRRQLSLCGAPSQEVVRKAPLIYEWVV
jgi:hypothetical protein